MNFGPQINGIHKFRLENGSVKVNAQFLIEEARRNTWHETFIESFKRRMAELNNS